MCLFLLTYVCYLRRPALVNESYCIERYFIMIIERLGEIRAAIYPASVGHVLRCL